MEVTSTNFKELLPTIENVIKQSTFIAIDCEFSGLNTVSEINAFDTPKQYYEKVRRNCRDFLVLQYGISAFRYVPEKKIFKQQSYNFYIFRRPIGGNIPDQRFLCQTSSINFLTTQGFDFNKLFQSGISYLNITEETAYRENLAKKQKQRTINNIQQNSSENLIQIPEDAQSFIDDIHKQLDNFLNSEESELELPRCNAFLRRLIYQTGRDKYKDKIVLQTKILKNKDRIIVATKYKSKEELEEIENKLAEEELKLLDDFIGFTKVLKILVDSGKLIVGHNLCLDLLHTIDKFLTPLPEDYQEFKECAHSLFSNILDTKLMANSEIFKDLITSTILKDLVDSINKKPFKIPKIEIEDNGQGYAIEDLKEHEAGYDAFITGVCFLGMWKYLGKSAKLEYGKAFENFDLLEPYKNRIFLMILRDNQFIHLGGADSNPSRDHVFYLTFPKEWKLGNIIELFSPFGNVYVAWINETSAYIGLYKKDQASVVLSTLSQSDCYNIMTYHRRQELLNGTITNSASSSYLVSKKRTLDPPPPSMKSTKKIKISEPTGFEESGGDTLEKVLKTPRNLNKSKTFMESDTWE